MSNSPAYDLDMAVRTILEMVSERNVHYIRVPAQPEDNDGEGYLVLYPLTEAGRSGSMSEPEGDIEYVYQVTSVGIDAHQTRWLQDRVREAFVDRSGSGYTHSITPASGGTVQDRWTMIRGGPVADGEQLFRADDTYIVKCGR